MFNFNIKKTAIYQAVRWEKNPFFRFAGFLKKLFLTLFLVVFILFFYGFFLEKFSLDFNRTLFSLSLIFLPFSLFFKISQVFFEKKLKEPVLKNNLEEVLFNPEEYNLAEFCGLEAARAAVKSLDFCRAKKISEVTPTIFLYFLLADNREFNFIFQRLLLDIKQIKELLKNNFGGRTSQYLKNVIDYSLGFQDAVIDSLKIAQKKGHRRIEMGDVATALAAREPVLKSVLADRGLKAEDVDNLSLWIESFKKINDERKKFWAYENLMKKGTLAKEWTAGYTVVLDQFSTDWTEIIKKEFHETIGHENAIKMVERILSRRETNNVLLLVGEAGTGRKSIIYALAAKSLVGRSLPELNYKRVVELDLPRILTQIQNLEEVEKILDAIFQEVVLAGNVILVIDEFHNYISQAVRPGIVDISAVLAPYLRLPQFPLVAITTYSGLHQFVELNPSIAALFEKVEVSEISRRETLILLENLALLLERKHNIFISYPALREVVLTCDRYLPALPFPEKAMELLDEVVIYAASHEKEKVLLPSHVDKIITEKTQIPVGEMEQKERKILLNLEKLIHQRIVNQEEAVREISSALKRARSEVTIRKGPMGVFLFLGPTGVGKTETSKALAEIYFGSEDRMIRLDMSEFQTLPDIPRLLGLPGQEGLLTTPVRENPFSLILLDEIEKSHPNILNLFLQVFDEGHLTDGQARKVDFRNSIIIATSNAGYQVILEALKENAEWSGVKQKLLDFLFSQAIFRPEFINRFDGVVVFRPLSKDNLLDIAELLLQKLKKNLEEKNIEFIITPSLKEKIVELGYNPVFGAREMRRVIQDKIENNLASALLSGKLVRGCRVEVDSEDFQLKINQ